MANADLKQTIGTSSGGQKTALYSGAGPARLAKTRAKAKWRPVYTDPGWMSLRRHAEAYIRMGQSWRFSWMENYQLLESYILPRRGIFINPTQATPNTMIRGMPINQTIVDPTGTYAMRRCAAGMWSGLMDPSHDWFKVKPAMFDRELVDAEGLRWFEQVEERIYTAFADSNFYDESHTQYQDLTTFGTGPFIMYEDDVDLIRCYTPCCGEYGLSSSSANRVETLWRLFNMTISAIVEMFGIENCPMDIQSMWQDKGANLQVEKLVAHIIEPNSAIYEPGVDGNAGVIPGGFTWREAYWCWGNESQWPLSVVGYMEKPHIVPRWDTTSNDAYGRSVMMDVMPDIIQLQVETLRKGEAIEKVVRPPMLASKELKNEPSSILPGKVTYVDQLGPEKGMRPIFTVNPEIKEMSDDIQAIQQRIREGAFNDLFAMMESLPKDPQRTAYEIATRNSEKLQQLGPVINRMQNEDLSPKVKRCGQILSRKGLLPPRPKSLRGVKMGLEFVGVLALAQKAARSANLERFAQTMTAMEKSDPSVADIWKKDVWGRMYGGELEIPQDIMSSQKEIAAIRAKRAQQQQAQQQAEMLQRGAQMGKDLSQIDVGGGQNAVQAMLGSGTGGGGSNP